jgi:hypothetical protein
MGLFTASMARVILISLQGVLMLSRGEISMEDRWLLFSGEVSVAVLNTMLVNLGFRIFWVAQVESYSSRLKL